MNWIFIFKFFQSSSLRFVLPALRSTPPGCLHLFFVSSRPHFRALTSFVDKRIILINNFYVKSQTRIERVGAFMLIVVVVIVVVVCMRSVWLCRHPPPLSTPQHYSIGHSMLVFCSAMVFVCGGLHAFSKQTTDSSRHCDCGHLFYMFLFCFFFHIPFIQFHVYVECIVISSLQFAHTHTHTSMQAAAISNHYFHCYFDYSSFVEVSETKARISYWITFWPFRSGYLYAMVLNMRLIDELMTVRRQ